MAGSFALYRVLSFSISSLLILGALLFTFLVATITSLISPTSSSVPCAKFIDITCKNPRALSLFRRSGFRSPTVTVFSAPIRPFLNSTEDPQYQALLSWLMLSPTPKIVLLGKDTSFHRVARELNGKVSVEPNIDYNLKGTPLFHSMFARAQQADTDVSVLINADILLLQDFNDALHKTHATYRDWVVFGEHWRLPGAFPVSFVRKKPGIVEMRSRVSDLPTTWDEVTKVVRSERLLEISGAIDFWAWNNDKDIPLLTTAMPPFVLGGGSYEKWLSKHIIKESVRAVVDATEAVANVRVVPDSIGFPNVSVVSWETYVNGFLSKTGNISSAPQTVAPWKLIPCDEPKVQNICFISQQTKAATKATNQALASHTDALQGIQQPPQPNVELHPWKSSPHSLEELLPQVADENRLVVMVGVNSNYKDLLLSFICRAQSLGVQNVLVAAFDREAMEYAYTQGLAVYFEGGADQERQELLAASDRVAHADECGFGSECFQRVTKLKSGAVLRVLRAGYSVLWSDVDVVWFENPVRELWEQTVGEVGVSIQSDEPSEEENSVGGANSGFYMARASSRAVEVFEEIVEHARGRPWETEQPSFYAVLCGEEGERRVAGGRECRAKNGLRVTFLSHARYPNGYVFRLWDSKDLARQCRRRRCAALHNNFITGKACKLYRLLLHGLFFSHPSSRLCLHPWHPLSPSLASSTPSPSFLSQLVAALNLSLPLPAPDYCNLTPPQTLRLLSALDSNSRPF